MFFRFDIWMGILALYSTVPTHSSPKEGLISLRNQRGIDRAIDLRSDDDKEDSRAMQHAPNKVVVPRRLDRDQNLPIDDLDSALFDDVDIENKESTNALFNDIDFLFPTGITDGSEATKSADEPEKGIQCVADNIRMKGACHSKETCRKKKGRISGPCERDNSLKCCVFAHTCGDSSAEKVTYFQSPKKTSTKSQGSLACDYDVIIQKDTCAVRVDYIHVNLARKLGGVCDVDQMYILNSVDGPTTGQCGPLSGYSTTVAVKPNQDKPLKIALLIQNEATYFWNIQTTQLSCNEVQYFKAPSMCGVSRPHQLGEHEQHFTPSYYNEKLWSDAKMEKKAEKTKQVWWSYPEPVFNTYHYSATKKYMVQPEILWSSTRQRGNNKMQVADRRIVGGTDAELHEFPWQVAIAMGDLFFCGGTLINDLFVLTAAHCIMTRDTRREEMVLHLGDHDLTVVNETNHIVRGVHKVMFHSHFHPFLLDNDIAMLQMDKPVIFTDNIQPVCLPNPSESYMKKKATVIGWGITTYPMGSPSPVLQKIQVEVISNFQCARTIEENVGAGMICAASTSLQGTCFGDSGGPLTVESKSGRSTLIGVVSYGLTGCALIPSFPDIYTRVSEYIKWIDVNAMGT